MRVGLVRNVALGMVALVGLGMVGCDENPTDFDPDSTTRITTNPSAMVLPAGVTTLLSSRTENAGAEPTWEEVSAAVDGSCGPGAITVETAATYEPSIQPPGQFDVTGGTTMGASCIELTGGGVSTTVEVTVVADSIAILGAPDNSTVNLNESVQLGVALLSDDGTAVTPFDPATDVVWSSDNEDAFTVDDTGLVTAVGVGGATITVTWTGFGLSRSATVSLATNQPTLNILNAPDTLVIFNSVDLGAELVNPTDPPADFGPFDENTDVVWSSSDDAIITVDPSTGVAEGVGPGEATITATWTGNETVFATVDIFVDVPPPTLVSASVATADPGDPVTITGTGLIPGAHTIFIDGEPLVDAFFMPTISSAVTASFLMFAGSSGDVEVTIGVDGNVSNALTISRTNGTDEPDDSGGGPATPNTIPGLPYNVVGYLEHDTDPDDFYLLTVGAATTVTIDLTWVDNSQDLDILVTDGAFTAFVCTDGATAPGASPVEQSVCSLPAAGDYLVWINHFAPTGGTSGYEMTVSP